MSLADGLRELTAQEADVALDEVLGNLDGVVDLARAQADLVFTYPLFLQVIMRVKELRAISDYSPQEFTERDRVMMAFGAIVTGATTALAAETKDREG